MAAFNDVQGLDVVFKQSWPNEASGDLNIFTINKTISTLCEVQVVSRWWVGEWAAVCTYSPYLACNTALSHQLRWQSAPEV